MPNEFLDHFLHLPILYFTQVRTAIKFPTITLDYGEAYYEQNIREIPTQGSGTYFLRGKTGGLCIHTPTSPQLPRNFPDRPVTDKADRPPPPHPSKIACILLRVSIHPVECRGALLTRTDAAMAISGTGDDDSYRHLLGDGC